MSQSDSPLADLTPETLATAEDMKSHMAKGSAWMVATRWVIRLLGLFSTIILARFLAPSDFGLFAIAILVIGFSEVVGKAGQEMAIIRHPSPTRDHVDSAWTASIFVGFVLGIAVVASAPLVAYIFNEPRAELLILVLSIRVFILGFENIGVVMFRRDLNFDKEFRYGVYEKVLQVVVTITLATILENYWALIIGSIMGRFMLTGLSYVVHPYRPRFSTKKLGEIWDFSFWILISRVGNFFSMRLDRFFVGTAADTRAMGFYHIGTELGRMPTYELIDPTSRALLPTYAKLTHNVEELKKGFINSLAFIATMTFSTGIGFSLIAEDFVLLVYGEKWAASVPIVTWIAIAAATQTFANTAIPVLVAMGRSRMVAVLNWIHVGFLTLSLFLIFTQFENVAAIAATRMAVAIAIAPFFIATLALCIPLKLKDVLSVIWRPAIATIFMALAVISLPNDWTEQRFLRLMLDSGCGVIVFTSVLMTTWALSGRPEGPEKLLFNLLKRLALYVSPYSQPVQRNTQALPVSFTETHGLALKKTPQKLYRGLFLDHSGPILMVTEGLKAQCFETPLTIGQSNRQKEKSHLNLDGNKKTYQGIALHHVFFKQEAMYRNRARKDFISAVFHHLDNEGTLTIAERNPHALRNIGYLIRQKLLGDPSFAYSTQKWARILEGNGFEKIESYALFSNIDDPNHMVPLDGRAAHTFFKNYAESDLFSNNPLWRWTRKILAWAGLTTLLNPAHLIIARKPKSKPESKTESKLQGEAS